MTFEYRQVTPVNARFDYVLHKCRQPVACLAVRYQVGAIRAIQGAGDTLVGAAED